MLFKMKNHWKNNYTKIYKQMNENFLKINLLWQAKL